MLWCALVSCLVVTIVFASLAAALPLDTTDVVIMHVFCIDSGAWNLVLVHMMWQRRSWIESAVQFLQQATLNALAGGGIAFICDGCVCLLLVC